MNYEFNIPVELRGSEKILYDNPLWKTFRIYANLVEVIEEVSLSNRQKDVLAGLLYFNSMLSESIPDRNERWLKIMSNEYKDQIKGVFNLSDANFQNLITSLKKSNIFVGISVIERICIVVPKEMHNQVNIHLSFK